MTAYANSSGFPCLPKGILLFKASAAFSGKAAPMGVEKGPGAIVLTLILYLARSLAMGRVIPMTAPLLPPYKTYPFWPSIPARLAT